MINKFNESKSASLLGICILFITSLCWGGDDLKNEIKDILTVYDTVPPQVESDSCLKN